MRTKLHPFLIFSLIISPSFIFSREPSVVSMCLLVTSLIIVVVTGVYMVMFREKQADRHVVFIGVVCIAPSIIGMIKKLYSYFSGQIQTIPLAYVMISPEFSYGLITVWSMALIALFASACFTKY